MRRAPRKLSGSTLTCPPLRSSECAYGQNRVWCPDARAAKDGEDYPDCVRKAGAPVGAVIEVVASGGPAGLGEPVYDKLDADLAKAMMSINAVKAVEIGAGLEAAALSGEENADEMRLQGNRVAFTDRKSTRLNSSH